MSAVDRLAIDASALPIARRIRSIPPREVAEHVHLGGVARHEQKGVHAAGLADSIDAADTLLHSAGAPRQLQRHDPSASRLQVESLAGGIGCRPAPGRRRA